MASLEDVMDAIGSLSLKVDNITRQHSSLIQLAFEDDTRKSVMAMRKAENVLQLAKLTQLIKFFYGEQSQTAILRCLPCYKVHLASKHTLGKLLPFKRVGSSTPLVAGPRAGSRTLIGGGGVYIHIFGLCPTNFF